MTATLIVAKVDDTERYFDKGAVLPAGVTAAERKRLVAAGLVADLADEPEPASGSEAGEPDSKGGEPDPQGIGRPPAAEAAKPATSSAKK
ncbi:hypothetical protein [Sinomonas sp. ASV322]|uniref:hypothetical protein n=1 Tax=Sinomonas sp. ASV322 TaxID=3041920 RepID=UPI0027DE1E4B|nr:hypothetical protein [Sinomonas sp. ASV322]MDQ4502178.1 hypothetical protein [Sinomonas sp. ASV322]